MGKKEENFKIHPLIVCTCPSVHAQRLPVWNTTWQRNEQN